MSLEDLYSENNGFTFYWKIKNFSLCPLLEESSLESPVFQVEELDRTQWRLVLQETHSETDVVLNVRREKLDEGPYHITVDIKLFLIKTNGDLITEEKQARFGRNFSLVKPALIQKGEIFEKKNLFLPNDTLTVGCFMKKLSHNSTLTAKCTAYTEISAEKCTIVSHIGNLFSVLQPLQTTTILKPSVSQVYSNFKISLKSSDFHPSSKSLEIAIEKAKSSTDVLTLCKLSVQNAKKNSVFLFEGRHKYLANTDDQKWELTNSIVPQDEDMESFNGSNYILHCTLVVSDGTCRSYIDSITYANSVLQIPKQFFIKHSISEKLRCLYNDRKFCDFTFRVDDKDFPVHKAVLAAVSPVFSAMFDREMKEKTSSLLTIEDMDADTVQRLIDFAYTENIDLQWDTAIDLYSAADKYQFSELKEYCASYVTSNLTVGNVANVLALSDLHQDDNLLKAASNFVFSHAKEVFRSENWKIFVKSKMPIANRIMQDMCMKLTENLT